MTPDDERPITAEELHRELARAPDYFMRERQFRLRQEQNVRTYQEGARPLKKELEEIGLSVRKISGVGDDPTTLRKALPVLLRWLGRIDEYAVNQDLVRTLADPAARPEAARPLVDMFQSLPTPEHGSLKWTVGMAIAEVVTPEVEDDVIRLASDPAHGTDRAMLVEALGRMGSDRAVRAARELLSDEEVAANAVIALGEARDLEAREDIARFVEHPEGWVRQEARRALRRIDALSP